MAAKQPIISAEDLKDVLECPVCLKVPRAAPVFQCERGHVVCNECHPKLVTCPVCRLPLGNTRSLISEKVLARYVKISYPYHSMLSERTLDKVQNTFNGTSKGLKILNE